MLRSRVGSSCTSKDRRRLSASWRNGRATMSTRLVKKMSSTSTDTVPDSIFDRSRMSDQVQEISAGAMDRAGELDLLRAQIAVRVFAKLLAEDQDAIERRAQ